MSETGMVLVGKIIGWDRVSETLDQEAQVIYDSEIVIIKINVIAKLSDSINSSVYVSTRYLFSIFYG